MPFLSQLFISLFFHSCFSRCFLPLAFSFFLPLPLKLSLGVAKRNFFSNPFRFFFSVLYRFGYLSFLCLENCQKMPKEVFSRTLFVFSFWLFLLPLHFKLTLEIVKRIQKEHFLEPFCVFFLLVVFLFLNFICFFHFFLNIIFHLHFFVFFFSSIVHFHLFFVVVFIFVFVFIFFVWV